MSYMCVIYIYNIYSLCSQVKKLGGPKETEPLSKVQKLVESRIKTQTLNLNCDHGKRTVKHMFECLLSIGRTYSHMIF